ncbi:MAG: Lrp/AsnC family transcriptional regulator [Zestosphaera sp.]
MSYLNKKSKNVRLDEVDLSILRCIQESPKTRIREIASKLGLPKSTVYYRMKKLEELKVIKGYNAILDSECI